MKHDDPDNPIFWADTHRKDWLFGHDARKLLNEDELTIPALPPYPAPEASVYIGKQRDPAARKLNNRAGDDGISI